ncbi:thiamine pyrophosphate-binding protein [Phocaeicola sp.]
MKVSDYIVSFLEEKGINVVFGYIGGMITHLVDSLDKSSKIKFIQTYHEQTAAIAAEGYALESGKFGVAICTSGPGVTNMMTGIADAYFGSIPVLYITGQVNTYEYKYDKPIRQQGFQEMDVVSIVAPITKYACLVDNAENIRYELEKALYLAMAERKGPVVIDLPMNISRAEIEPNDLHSFQPVYSKKVSFDFTEVVDLLKASERPMLLLGAGCIGNEAQIQEFVKRTQIPVVTSLMGRGVIDETYTYYIGMVGSYGNRCANMAVSKADLLLVLGSRLDTRQTGAMIDSFLPNGNIVHVDIDSNELEYHRLNNRIKVNLAVSDFLEGMNINKLSPKNYHVWNQWTLKVKNLYNQDKEIERFVENKAPYRLMQALNEIIQENDVITADIGQNQMWAAQTIRLKKGQRFVTSGGLAPMGFSLPVAIGIAFANPDKTIYCINGDGGFHMAVQALMLISQYQLNIKVIVLNNEALGMITQFQHLYFNDRMAGTTNDGGYCVPDIESISKAYGIPYIEIVADNLEEMKKELERTFLVANLKIDGLTVVSPKLEYNKPIEKMIPLLEDVEFDNAMKV